MSSEDSEDTNEGINLLSLDGGGVRGVSSLVILDRIMNEIKELYDLAEVPKPCDFFHMIGGTSTGGLIAIMLGRLRMSTKEALEAYDKCSAKIFALKNRKLWSISTKFRATALQEVVQGIVKERGMGERMRDLESHKKGKVVVCVVPADNIKTSYFVRSFYGDHGSRFDSKPPDPTSDPNSKLEPHPDPRLDENWDDNWDRDVLIWEAARATTAASTYFKPQTLGTPARAYIDAAVVNNNPLESVIDQAIEEFGSGKRLGCVVSIGTGTRDVQLEGSGPGYYPDVINMVKNSATDTEEAHRKQFTKLRGSPGAYYRFNVPDAAERVKLSHYKKMPLLKDMAAEYLEEPNVAMKIRQVAQGLKDGVFTHRLALGHISASKLDMHQIVPANTHTHSMESASPYFTGRQDILEKLDSFFTRRETVGPRREFLLHGMGGVGKTDVALKFSEVFADRFPRIFYIDGSKTGTVDQSYAEIARQYGLGETGSTEAMKHLALRWIESLTQEWLMIFDDCALGDRTAQLPGRAKGNIIYTSRSNYLGRTLPHDCVAEVTPFPEADALDCLSRVSGLQITSEEDIQSAQAIVQELGALPLAIDQAATYIRRHGSSLDAYLERHKKKVRIISGPRFKNTEVENPTVYAALELTCEAIEARRIREGRSGLGLGATTALKVLGILSFYHNRAIPARIMSMAAKERGQKTAYGLAPLSEIMKPHDDDLEQMFRLDANGEWDQHCFGVGISVLESFNLIKLDSRRQTISMHVLIHTWARHRLTEKAYRQYGNLATIIITEAIVMSRRWADAFFTRSLSPHIAVCHAKGLLDIPSMQYLTFLHRKMGWYFHLNKDFARAEQAYSTSIDIGRMEFGNYSWNVMVTMEELASLYHEMGRLGEAERAYLELIARVRGRIKDCEAAAVEADEQQEPGPGRRSSSTRRLRKALGEKLSGRLSQFPFIRVPESGRDDVSTGRSTAEPGGSSMPRKSKGRRVKPQDTTDDVEILWVIERLHHADLARVFMDQGRFAKGRSMLIKVLQLLEEEGCISEDHVEFLRLEHEVKALTEPGNLKYWTEREKQMNDLSDSQRASSGSQGLSFFESDAYFQFNIALANCILKSCMWDAAYQIYSTTSDTFDRAYGPCDKRILEIRRRMVDCLVEGEKADQAVEVARDCVQRAKHVYGEYHQETVMALDKLAEALFFEGMEETDESEQVMRQAFVKAEVCFEPGDIRRKLIQNRMRTSIWVGKMPMPPKHQETDRECLDLPSDWEAYFRPGWEASKATLDLTKAKMGADHITARRFAHYVGDGPPKTLEEYLERVRAACGPNSSKMKTAQETVDSLRATLGQVLGGCHEVPSTRGDEFPISLCTCGEPVHAEGSRAGEAPGKGAPGSNTLHPGKTGETEAASVSNSDEAMAPARGEAVSSSSFRRGRLKNVPYAYASGLYY